MSAMGLETVTASGFQEDEARQGKCQGLTLHLFFEKSYLFLIFMTNESEQCWLALDADC